MPKFCVFLQYESLGADKSCAGAWEIAISTDVPTRKDPNGPPAMQGVLQLALCLAPLAAHALHLAPSARPLLRVRHPRLSAADPDEPKSELDDDALAKAYAARLDKEVRQRLSRM